MKSARTRRIIDLVTSNDNHLLDLPKYETTKGLSREDQFSAIIKTTNKLNQFKNIKDEEELITDETYTKVNGQESKEKQIKKKETFKIQKCTVVIRQDKDDNGESVENKKRKREESEREQIKKKETLKIQKSSVDTRQDKDDNGECVENEKRKRQESEKEQIKKKETLKIQKSSVDTRQDKDDNEESVENKKRKRACANRNNNSSLQFSTSTSDFSSSGTEYIPDTESDFEAESEGEVCFSRQTENASLENSTITKKKTSPPFVENNHYGQVSASSNNADKRSEPSGNMNKTIVNFGSLVASTSTSKVEQFSNSRPWTKKNTCPYCWREVTHFPRHLKRNHGTEGAVKEFLSLSAKDPKRKEIIDCIRRQGNYACNLKTNIIQPVRRQKGLDTEIVSNLDNSKERYVSCDNCLGFFSRNYLRRHKKKCWLRTEQNVGGAREHHLSKAQLFAICSGSNSEFYKHLRLKQEVFPIMRSDDISKTAMQDFLICMFAESLLCKHKRVQMRNVISNKMRELGRLLISLKTMTGLQTLFEGLKPEMFDNFVSATKIISGYSNETRTFKASSLALHMGTTLKQVCDVAMKLVIKKSNFLPCADQDQVLKEIKRLRNLIENHWNSELSSLALKNLNENKFIKPKLLPVTSDVIKFQQYVSKEASRAINKLQQGPKADTEYRLLSECILGLTLLLNRKRIGEIQYLSVKTYSNTEMHPQQEEFIQSLSETERNLTRNFKRVVTLGKGSKPVPILFSKDMQKFISVLLDMRSLYVPVNNEYLFANPNTENRWLSGYHTLKKLAEKSGVNDKSLFTSTRLRKQIATVLQVLNVSENEMEQLANFLGHTKKTHQEYYRLPQDVYQTAKVSKLLLAINSGKGHLYQGKTLEEIELSDNFDSDSDSVSNETVSLNDAFRKKESSSLNSKDDGFESQGTLEMNPFISAEHSNVQDQDQTIQKRKNKKAGWTTKQKELIKRFFKKHIQTKRAPRKHEVEEFVNQYPMEFKDKKWDIIKAYVYNCYK